MSICIPASDRPLVPSANNLPDTTLPRPHAALLQTILLTGSPFFILQFSSLWIDSTTCLFQSLINLFFLLLYDDAFNVLYNLGIAVVLCRVHPAVQTKILQKLVMEQETSKVGSSRLKVHIIVS